MRIEVVYCPAGGEAERVELQLADGSTVQLALAASGLLARHASIDLQRVGVWGRLAPLDRMLRDGDRVECYRPLAIDPMQARRLRAARQRRPARG